MKTKKMIAGILLLTVGLFSCKKEKVAPCPKETKQIFMHTIGKNNLYGSSSEGFTEENIVINDSVAWNDLKDRMNMNSNVTYNFTEQNIDFSQWTVIASFDQIRATGGHGISYTNPQDNANNVSITIEHQHTGNVQTQNITQPYIVAKISKTWKPIVFN
jgi:hypothetical protein